MPPKPKKRCEYCKHPMPPSKAANAKYHTTACRVSAWRERRQRTASIERAVNRSLSSAIRRPDEKTQVLLAALAIVVDARMGKGELPVGRFLMKTIDKEGMKRFGTKHATGNQEWNDCLLWAEQSLRDLVDAQ